LFNSAVKALYGWSNNHFAAKATDYFGLDSNLNPLSHTWSLGVEEQFYLIFPLLLLLIGVGRRRALPILLGLSIASLGLSLWWTREAPILAFFLMPSRFWELSAGSALLLAQLQGFKAGSGKAWLRVSGYGLLLLALFKTSAQQGFPAPGALPAALATLLLLQAGFEAATQRFLPWRWLERVLVACGLLSYSLYLWHWPVLIFLRWTYGIDRVWLYLLSIGLSFGFAWLAYVLIEQPVRRKPLAGPWQWGLALAAIGFTWTGIDALGYKYKGKIFLGSSPEPVPENEIIEKNQPMIPGTNFSALNCVVDTWNKHATNATKAFGFCSGLGSGNNFYLVGDSHAQHLLPMLGLALPGRGFQLRAAFKNSCLVSANLYIDYKKKKYHECFDFSAQALNHIIENGRSGDILLLSAWLNRHLGLVDVKGRRNKESLVWVGDRQISLEAAREVYVAEMQGYAAKLLLKNVRVILLVDLPPLARSPVTCNSKLFGNNKICAPAQKISKKIHSDTLELLNRISSNHKNVYIFDPSRYLFQDLNITHSSPSGKLIYSDTHHLSVSGSRSLSASFQEFLRENELVTK
jgi:hypothetical protein